MDSSDREKHCCGVFHGLSLGFANTVAYILKCKVMKLLWGYWRERGKEKQFLIICLTVGRGRQSFPFFVALLQMHGLVDITTFPERASPLQKALPCFL